MTWVKICGLTREADVQAAIAAGARAVGFVHVPGSRRFVDRDRLLTLARAAGPEVRRVAVVADLDLEAALSLARTRDLDVLQLHGHEPPDDARRLAKVLPHGTALWKALKVESPADLAHAAEFAPHVEALVLDSGGGTGMPFDWELLAGWIPPCPIILAGGLTPENARAAVLRIKPVAVDVSSGVENAPGRKDPERIVTFMASVIDADRFLDR